MIQLILSLVVGASLGAALGRFAQCPGGGCPLTASWKSGMIYGAFMGLMFYFAAGSPGGSFPKSEHVKAVTDSEFETEVLKESKPVLVDFYATWCGPCKAFAPTLHKVAAEFSGKVKVLQVNVDQTATLASRYNVRSIPTLVFFKNGKVADTITGALSETALREKLQSMEK